MFPPQLAHVMIRWLTKPDDLVYDPFCGRGTVGLEAALLGRRALMSDANPLAQALAAAKVQIPSATRAHRRLRELRVGYAAGVEDLVETPESIRMLYTDETLRQLLYLRRELRAGPADVLLRAVVLGMLHGGHSAAGATRGFSISMPNTFAMAPAYVERYISKHGLVAPECDVFAMLELRLARLQLPSTTLDCGRSWAQDATAPIAMEERPKLVLTSPPYLQVISYGKYNWVRLWFLGAEATSVDRALCTTSSLPRYLVFMESVLLSLRDVVAEDGYVALVIGDVRRGEQQLDLAAAVRDSVALPAGWHDHGTLIDRLPTRHKVSRIWKQQSGRATKTDRILLLSPRAVELPPLSPIRWTLPSFAHPAGAVP